MPAQFFVDEISKRLEKSIDFILKNAMEALQNYHWPGNVRELEKTLWKVAGKNGAAEFLGLNPGTLHGRM